MPIQDQEIWKSWEEANKDPYGKCCVDVAREAMKILDGEQEFDPYDIITRADRQAKAGGITGFMAGCVAKMISACHSRGDEFRRKWNISNQIKDEGEKANDSGGVLNPALLTIST